MIPFGTQRGYGADLATHLLNAHDNEKVELAEVRGAIARDLHGAFEEWELQARALTKCEKYLYSLSINPDPKQGPITPDQYRAYIDKAEAALGLTGQPRAVVFHEKYGRHHCHVIWSRIDAQNGKAVHMAFDRQKLMAVTREFALEHGFDLPRGYRERTENKPLSLYDRVKQNETGLSREDHQQRVTEAWRRSDSPRAFVRALEDRGYLLATGKRPYVLVDIYGHTHALPRLIADRQVRAKDVQAFLAKEFPPEGLPSVEEAQQLVAKHQDVSTALAAAEQRAEALAELKQMQAARRAELGEKFEALKGRHHAERGALAQAQKAARERHKTAFHAHMRTIRLERAQRLPKGLAHFLGKVTGMNLIRTKLQRYRDGKSLRNFLQERAEIKVRQANDREALKQRQILQKRELERQDRALRKVENRERRALDTQLLRQQRTLERGQKQMPLVAKQKDREKVHKGALSKEHNTSSGMRTKTRRKKQLSQAFTKAAGGKEGGDKGETGKEAPGPQRTRRPRRRRRDRDKDRGR